VLTDAESLMTSTEPRSNQNEATVRVPANRRYVGALRALTTALAVQCDLTVDEIEDVQMSVNEACALVLPYVDPAQPWIDVRFRLSQGRFLASVCVATVVGATLDRDDLSWTVLEALSDDANVSADSRSLAITFTKLRVADRP